MIIPYDGEFWVYVGDKLVGIRATIGGAHELLAARI